MLDESVRIAAWGQRLTGVLIGLTLVACKFPDLAPLEEDSAFDATTIDATPSCDANSITCDDTRGTYVECSPDGTVVREIPCALGCDMVEVKCVDIAPTNDVGAHLDMARDLPESPIVAFSGMSTIHQNGTVFNGGTSVDVPQADHDGMRILIATRLVP